MTELPDDPDDVPNPRDTRCPACGSPATDESITQAQLSDLGYLHKDVSYECTADGCTETWVHGIPVGSASAFADDLTCGVCGECFLIHRVVIQTESVLLHKKCPGCFNFATTHRDTDDGGRALVGYPQITGALNPDKPYGYDPDDE
jgi:hypothetical protein